MNSGFDSSLVIDPLPHDKPYFEDHLAFLKNYYETVSHGGTIFDASAMDVLPLDNDGVYVLDHPMWHYNYNSDEDLLNQRLVELFVESVAEASLDADIDTSHYDAVVVFHAGVGKDFSLGFDATPFDIPSAYISEADLRDYSGTVPLPPGITRGLILPEGENQREALDFGVELSLNGIMVKLFGNWLGLPDLFDTQTGLSGVGRWGMMDQGSGNVFALVPSIPTAWSRVFMGWETPEIRLPSGREQLVRVGRSNTESAPRVVKIPVTSREYYLVENRDSDADSVGFVQLWDRNDEHWMKVYHDQSIEVQQGFRVAVRANNYDFGIPGSGILIWHIDEDAIENGLSTNTVNGDPNHRGVDLVEADAAQDIGQEYGFASAGSGTELGVPEDAWYFDNSAYRAANGGALTEVFSDATFPSARLYDRAFTRLSLSSFSAVDSVMSFNCRMEQVSPAFPATFSDLARWTSADMDGDGSYEMYFQDGNSLYCAETDTLIRLPLDLSGLQLVEDIPAVNIDDNPGDELILSGNEFGLVSLRDNVYQLFLGNLGAEDLLALFPARTSEGVGRIIAIQNAGQDSITISAYSDSIARIASLALAINHASGTFSAVNIDCFPTHRFLAAAPGEAACLEVHDAEIAVIWSFADPHVGSLPMVISNSDTTCIYWPEIGYLNAADGSLICSDHDCGPPAVDWDDNGIPDGGGWLGKNPLSREDPPTLETPVQWTVDLDATGNPDLLGLDNADANQSRFMRIHAKTHLGRTYSGFPLAVTGADSSRTPFRFGSDHSLYIMSVASWDDSSHFCPIRLTNAGTDERFEYMAPVSLINIGPYRLSANNRSDWVYCWPNPASFMSYIRISVGYPAHADIHVFDLAGRKIAELSQNSVLPEPFEVAWDVTGIESGVYIGQVKVQGNGTSLESQLKIAVVR